MTATTAIRRLEDDFEDICLQESSVIGTKNTNLHNNNNNGGMTPPAMISDSSSLNSSGVSSRDSSSSVTSVESNNNTNESNSNSDYNYIYNTLQKQQQPATNNYGYFYGRETSWNASSTTNNVTSSSNSTTTNNSNITLQKKRSMNSLPRQQSWENNLHQVPTKKNITPFLRRATSTSKLQINTNTSTTANSNNTGPATSSPTLPRRQFSTRQQQRPKLTREQIEQNFDSNYDIEDDLADDSCIWNVPLSPALYAKSRTVSASSSNSLDQQQQQPDSPNTTLSSIKESEPTQVFSDPQLLRDLGEDAQNLTEQFQTLPGAKQYDEMIVEKRRQKALSAPVPARQQQEVQGQDKQKHRKSSGGSSAGGTSNTRPGWLPPKSPDEDRKHMQEYQKLIEKTALADKKKQERRVSEQLARKKQQSEDEIEWGQKIIPKFDTMIKQSRTRELWWRGLPEKYRSKIWKLKIENKLNVNQQVFDDCKAKSLKQNASILPVIAEAANQAFPTLHIFQAETGPLHEDLKSVLLAFAGYKPTIGYKDGLNNIAAMFLLNLPSPLDAFISMVNILEENPLTYALYSGSYDKDQIISSYYGQFLKVLHTKLPSLYDHFQHIKLAPSAYLEPLLIGWFSRHVGIDISARIYDIFIFEGDGFLLRVALGILTALEHKLYGSSEEILNEIGWNVDQLELGEEDQFILTVRNALKVDNDNNNHH